MPVSAAHAHRSLLHCQCHSRCRTDLAAIARRLSLDDRLCTGLYPRSVEASLWTLRRTSSGTEL